MSPFFLLLVKIVLYLIVIVGFLIGALIWMFNHLAQIYILLTWFYHLFSWVSRRFRLRGVTNQIQSRINIGAESIESEVQGVMPHPMKIDWIKRGEEYAQLEDGQVVVRIRNEFDNSRNIVAATMLYLQGGLLKVSRPYIDQQLLQALDLDIAWKIIGKNKESDVTNYFLNQVYNPIVEDDSIIASDCDKIGEIDSRGLKTRIFMRELRGVGLKAGELQERPTKDLKAETRSFADFLFTIATSDRGARYPLDFIGRKIKAGIILVARFETMAMYGLRIHQQWLKKKNEMGVETTYILAIGHKNVDLAQQLAQWAQNERLIEIIQSQPFIAPSKSGKTERTIVITCHSTQARADTLLDPEEELRAILIRCIPAVAAGDIEVLDTAREPGIQSKVIVRSVAKNIDPVWVCIGKNEETLKKVLVELSEFVRFIPFSEDPQIFLVDCLNIPRDKVRSVNIDHKKKQAKVVVEDRESAAIAIGSKGSNARLTTKITGLNIQILTEDQAEHTGAPQLAKSPEELLEQAVTQEIPEVANKTIIIKNMLRDPGFQSKVVVQQTSGKKTAVSICMGPNRQHAEALAKKLGEFVFFVEFHEDMKSYLIACLGIYPNRVLSININPNLRTAEILVNNKDTCAKAIGENGINVKQAAQLTGLRYIRIQPQEQ